MSEAAEILKAARELISDPAHWLQNDFAADAAGIETESGMPDAVCFCAYGALNRVTHTPDGMSIHLDGKLPRDVAIRTLIDVIGGREPHALAEFNDEHSHAEILSVFDKAIEFIESGANAAANSPALCTEASPTRTSNTIGDGNHG